MLFRLEVDAVVEIHSRQVRSGALIVAKSFDLSAALDSPFAGFGDTEFYPSLVQKAGKLIEAVGRAHAFTDGNKRIAWLCGHTFLGLNGVAIADVDPQESADVVIQSVTGQLADGDVAFWLATHL